MPKRKKCRNCKAAMIKRTGPPLMLTCRCGNVEQPTKPMLVKAIDAVFSRAVRLGARDSAGGVKCYTCPHVGTVESMQAGHWIPRQHMATRWERWNVRPQCLACNMRYGGRPQEYRERLVLEFGASDVDRMAKRRFEVRQWTIVELQGFYSSLVDEVAELSPP